MVGQVGQEVRSQELRTENRNEKGERQLQEQQFLRTEKEHGRGSGEIRSLFII